MTIRVEFIHQEDEGGDLESLTFQGDVWIQATKDEDHEKAYLLGLRGVAKKLVGQVEIAIERGLVSQIVIEEGDVVRILYPVETDPNTKLVGVKFEKGANDQNEINSRKVAAPKEKDAVGWLWAKNIRP